MMTRPTRESTTDREMILMPNHWPLLNLPLKRHPEDGGIETGVLVTGTTDENADLVVFIGNMYLMHKDSPRIVYHGVDELLRDGWIVD